MKFVIHGRRTLALHAVACFALGVHVHDVRLSRTRGGQVCSAPSMVAITGFAAESLIGRASPPRLRGLTIPERFAAWDAAKALVAGNRAAVEALARELMRRNRLSGDEVAAIARERHTARRTEA